jgi:CRP/FNR family transcriptional regulator
VQPFQDHTSCLALASVLRGKLCDTVFTAEVASIPKGARVYQPGDRDAVLHRVVTGLVGLSAVAPNGDEVTLRLYGPSDVFGELCFCGGAQMHFATALEPTEIVTAHADRVIAALHNRPDLALDLIKVLSERLASAYAELQAVSADSLIVRLARKLFDLCASADADGWYRLPRRFTHDELARLLGVRRESLTRAMIDLRSLGLIDYGSNAPIRVALAPVRRFIATARATELLPRQHPTE